MLDITTRFREFARLDVRRLDQGLTLPEHERWCELKAVLDRQLGRSGDTRPPAQRRSAPRVDTRMQCAYSTDQRCQEAVVCNLSTGGVFIRTDWPLPVKSRLTLDIRIEDTGAQIAVQGVVVSNNVDVDRGTARRGMGVRFVGVDAKTLDQLSSLYSRELARSSRRLESA